MVAAQSQSDIASMGKLSLLSFRAIRAIRGQPAAPRSRPLLSSDCAGATLICWRHRKTMCPFRSFASDPGMFCRRIEADRGDKFLAGPKLGDNRRVKNSRQEPSNAPDQHAVRFAPTVEEISPEDAQDGRPSALKKSPVQSPSLEPEPTLAPQRRLSHFHFEPVSLPASRVSLDLCCSRRPSTWLGHTANTFRQHPLKEAPGNAIPLHKCPTTHTRRCNPLP